MAQYTENSILETRKDSTDKKGNIFYGCASSAMEKAPQCFYRQRFVNYTGVAASDRAYTEVIADWLLKDSHLAPLCEFEVSYARDSYWLDHPRDNPSGSPPKNEKPLAKWMHGKKDFGDLGICLDYQTPLNEKQDTGSGEIDLVSAKGDILYIIELKRRDSCETLLRCALEIATYHHIVEEAEKRKGTFLSSFTRDGFCPQKIVPAILISEDHYLDENGRQKLTQAEVELQDISKQAGDEQNKGSREHLRLLIKKLNIEVFSYSIDKENRLTIQKRNI